MSPSCRAGPDRTALDAVQMDAVLTFVGRGTPLAGRHNDAGQDSCTSCSWTGAR